MENSPEQKDTLKYKVRIQEKDYGPYSNTQLKDLIAKHKISLSDPCLNVEKNIWTYVGDVEDLVEIVPVKPKIDLMLPKYYTLKQDENKAYGPYNKGQIISKIKTRELSFYSYIFHQNGTDWERVKDSAEFKSFLPKLPFIEGQNAVNEKPENLFSGQRGVELEDIAPLAQSLVPLDEKTESFDAPKWVFEKNEIFPLTYRYHEIIKMLNSAIITFDHKIKIADKKEFNAIRYIPEFKYERILEFTEKSDTIPEGLVAHHPGRAFVRCSFYGAAVVKYQDKQLHGICNDISAGGCFIELRPMPGYLAKDENIMVKILPGDIPLTFEVKAIIRVVVTKGTKGIGVSFIDLPSKKVEDINNYIQQFFAKIK